MTKLVKISIDDASNKQLLFFAQRVLGLDVSTGANNTSIRAKIEAAAPGTTEIDVEGEQDVAPATGPVGAETTESSDEAAIPSGREGTHFRYDPKVIVRVAPTADKTRTKDVHIAVNGDVIVLKRGEDIPIPYRFYLALEQAVEKVARETNETNPVTHMPIIEWVEQPSYEFSVRRMPTAEEIAAYHARTDGVATV